MHTRQDYFVFFRQVLYNFPPVQKYLPDVNSRDFIRVENETHVGHVLLNVWNSVLQLSGLQAAGLRLVLVNGYRCAERLSAGM
jgi:hypothetical protein